MGKGFTWPNLHSPNARAKFKVDSIPTLVVIGKTGKITTCEVGHSQAVRTAITRTPQNLGLNIENK